VAVDNNTTDRLKAGQETERVYSCNPGGARLSVKISK